MKSKWSELGPMAIVSSAIVTLSFNVLPSPWPQALLIILGLLLLKIFLQGVSEESSTSSQSDLQAAQAWLNQVINDQETRLQFILSYKNKEKHYAAQTKTKVSKSLSTRRLEMVSSIISYQEEAQLNCHNQLKFLKNMSSEYGEQIFVVKECERLIEKNLNDARKLKKGLRWALFESRRQEHLVNFRKEAKNLIAELKAISERIQG